MNKRTFKLIEAMRWGFFAYLAYVKKIVATRSSRRMPRLHAHASMAMRQINIKAVLVNAVKAIERLAALRMSDHVVLTGGLVA